MRIAVASITTVAALLAAPAFAGPYADVGQFGQYTFSVEFQRDLGAGSAVLGNSFTIINGGVPTSNNKFSTEELTAVQGFLSVLSAGFKVTTTVGAANNGQTVTTPFDRAIVTDVADGNSAGVEVGTITFTIANTVAVDIFGTTSQTVSAAGLITANASTFYDASQQGSWSFGGSYGAGSGFGSGSITISVPPDPSIIPTAASEPGVLVVAGAGLLAAAAMRRRSA